MAGARELIDSPVRSRGDGDLLRAIADQISAMVAYWDSSLRCRFANRAYERWFGVSPEALIGKHIRDLLGPLYELNLPYIQGALRGEPQEFEREIPDPKGGPSRHSLAQYIPDVADGKVRGFFVLVTDVSRLKRAEEAVRRSEAQFAGIVSISADAIVSIDDDDRIVVFNESAERTFGYRRDEVLGQSARMLVPTGVHDGHLLHVRALADRPSDRPELFWRRKSGEEFLAETALSKLRVDGTSLLTLALRDVTERRRIEDERRVFAALLENSSDFIAVADPHGHPLYVNPAGRRMIGMPADLPAERTKIADYYLPEDRAFAEDVILPALLERGAWSGESRLRHWQTNAPIPVSDSHFMIHEPESGRVLGMATVSRDISRERAAYAQLREAEERLRLTIDEAPIGMALVALDGRFLRVNRALCEIVGYAPDELTGLSFQAITHPDDLDADVTLARELLAGRIPRYQLGKRYVKKDGAIVDVMLHGSIVRDARGEPVHFIAQIEDVTDRRRAEYETRLLSDVAAALAASLEYEQTLTTVAELSVRDFADHCIVDLVEDDEHVRRLKVACRDPAQAELCRRLMRMPHDRSRPHLVRSVLETRRPMLVPRASDEVIVSFAQSEEHLALLRAAAIRSIVAVPLVAHDQLLGAIAFLSSSPTRVYGPADLRLAEELASRAAQAIENARLYRTARRATQVRDEVLGIVAHDLRSPLNGIVLQATQLRRRHPSSPASPEDVRASAEAIERAAKRMNRLIQDLLDVSRMEANRMRIEASPVPTTRLVADVADAHRPLAAAAAIQLVTDAAPDLPDVRADRDRLLQVFENLLGNALKFTPPGGQITISATRRPGQVLFSVSDTGRGIASEDLPNVFDRFWQARKTEHHGAGLGLPIVKGIVEAHHGTIRVESEPGQGTTFFFTIPTV